MTNHLIDQAAHSADAAIRSTQLMGEEVSARVHHGMDAARDGMHHASDRTVAYIRHEPVKALLLAAAAGAALTALVFALGRSGRTR